MPLLDFIWNQWVNVIVTLHRVSLSILACCPILPRIAHKQRKVTDSEWLEYVANDPHKLTAAQHWANWSGQDV